MVLLFAGKVRKNWGTVEFPTPYNRNSEDLKGTVISAEEVWFQANDENWKSREENLTCQ